MELPDNAAAVSRMQHYIEAHMDEEITLNKHANAAGYGAGHFSSVMMI